MIGAGAVVSTHAIVYAGTTVGERAIIGDHAFVRERCAIGAQTVIGREKRDYVWIMARTPVIAEADYQRLLNIVAAQGYDINKVRRVPQQWK